MIVDSSALIALIQDEPCALQVAAALAADPVPAIAAPTATESLIVLTSRYNAFGRTAFERVRQQFGISLMDFTETHSAAAHLAFTKYGKGRHRAALNFGDCMSYAAAKVARASLLAVGDDFTRTDLEFDGVIGRWPDEQTR